MAGDELLVKNVLLEGGEESKAAQRGNTLLVFRWTAPRSRGMRSARKGSNFFTCVGSYSWGLSNSPFLFLPTARAWCAGVCCLIRAKREGAWAAFGQGTTGRPVEAVRNVQKE